MIEKNIKCMDCLHTIASDATTCPTCGSSEPFSPMKVVDNIYNILDRIKYVDDKQFSIFSSDFSVFNILSIVKIAIFLAVIYLSTNFLGMYFYITGELEPNKALKIITGNITFFTFLGLISFIVIKTIKIIHFNKNDYVRFFKNNLLGYSSIRDFYNNKIIKDDTTKTKLLMIKKIIDTELERFDKPRIGLFLLTHWHYFVWIFIVLSIYSTIIETTSFRGERFVYFLNKELGIYQYKEIGTKVMQSLFGILIVIQYFYINIKYFWMFKTKKQYDSYKEDISKLIKGL